jgi:hypothetical protein
MKPLSNSYRVSSWRAPFRLLVGLFGLYTVGLGMWALLSPLSFYTTIVLFPPYNQHLTHDAGAFFAGLGVALLLALVCRDAILTALGASSAAAVFHTVSHIMDLSLGGRPDDLEWVGGFAVVLLVLTAVRLRILRTETAQRSDQQNLAGVDDQRRHSARPDALEVGVAPDHRSSPERLAPQRD